MPAIPLPDRFVGCLLGHAVGDALGAPFEGLTSEIIFASFGRAAQIVAHPPVDALCYTDDTQLTIALAEALLERGRVEADALASAFARNFDPRRGYGSGARRIIQAMIEGDDYAQLARTLFPGGSYGNGAAMRVAPVALLFHDDLDRVWEEARQSAILTHTHPLGVEGAQLLAIAIALQVQQADYDHDALYGELYHRATQEEYQWLLRTAWKLTANDSLALLGSSLPAHRSVVTAIACFTTAPHSYPDAIARAISLGDDVDTVAAMAGALAGARLGAAAVPAHLTTRLEDGPKGRSYIASLARQLLDRFASHRPPRS